MLPREKELLAEEFARNLLSWKNSGFSIDNSVRLTDAKSKESLAEYIARPPLSLKKIRYEPFKAKVLFHTRYSDYFKENVHLRAGGPHFGPGPRSRARRVAPGPRSLRPVLSARGSRRRT